MTNEKTNANEKHMRIAEMMNPEGLTFLGIPLEEHEKEFWATARPAEERERLHKEDIENGIAQANINLTDIMFAIPFDRLLVVANATVLDAIDDECPFLYNRIFDAFLYGNGNGLDSLKRAKRLIDERIAEIEEAEREQPSEPSELAEAYANL